jgi:hypothetical protein
MRNLAAAIALSSLCACAGYTNGSPTAGGPDSGVGLDQDSGPDGGDGGSDGGDGGDAGDAGPDAGCVALSFNGSAVDNCQGGAFTAANVSVSGPAQGCSVSILLATASNPCTGVATYGTLDAFDGGCGQLNLPCTSTSLPGTLVCNNAAGTGTCTIRICDAGTCP